MRDADTLWGLRGQETCLWRDSTRSRPETCTPHTHTHTETTRLTCLCVHTETAHLTCMCVHAEAAHLTCLCVHAETAHLTCLCMHTETAHLTCLCVCTETHTLHACVCTQSLHSLHVCVHMQRLHTCVRTQRHVGEGWDGWMDRQTAGQMAAGATGSQVGFPLTVRPIPMQPLTQTASGGERHCADSPCVWCVHVHLVFM